jgi:U3 small nucleolar RNA-associated protein 11
MSSLRNAVKRVTHKERSQPDARKKLGFLEKHKDYVERAKDYHKKQDYLNVLKKKAADRNPDEFYFKMHKSGVNAKGVHKEKKDGSLDTATVKNLKTQDMGYIVHKKAVDDKKIKKMQASLHLIGEEATSGGKKRKHKVFVEDEEEQAALDPVAYLDTVPELLSHGFNRLRKGQLERLAEEESAPTAEQLKRALDKRAKSYKALEARDTRAGKLAGALKGLQHQRNMMGKGSKRKVGGKEEKEAEEDQGKGKGKGKDGGGTQYKWKRRRLK